MRKRRNALGLLVAALAAAMLAGTVHALVPSDPQASHPTYAGPQPSGGLGRDLRLTQRGHRDRRHRHRSEPPGPRRRSPRGARLRRPRRRCHEPAGRARHRSSRRRRGPREQRDRRDGNLLLVRAHVAPRARPRRDRAQHQHRSRDRLRGRPRRRSGEREHLRAPLPADAAECDRARARSRRSGGGGRRQRGNRRAPVPRRLSRDHLGRSSRDEQRASLVTPASAAGSSSRRPSALRSPPSAEARTSAARPRLRARSSRGSWASSARRRHLPRPTSSRPPSHEPPDPFPERRHGLVDAAAALVALGRPEPHLQPAVVGDPIVGESLEAFSGVWSGAGLTATFQWERCQSSCVPIEGATSARYQVAPGDVGFGLRVAASSDATSPATSATTSLVVEAPGVREPPSIVGRARVGALLTARPGTWAGTDLRFSTSWLRCRGVCTEIKPGARYRVRSADRGYRLRVAVLASNSVGSVSARSNPTAVVR